jgi:peptide alpha-N-acetyltransferase
MGISHLGNLHLPFNTGETWNQSCIPYETSSWYSDENDIIRHKSTTERTLPPLCTINIIQFCVQSESINAHLALTNTNLLYKKSGYLFQFEDYNYLSDKDFLKESILRSASKSNVLIKELNLGKSTNIIRFICSIFPTSVDASGTEKSMVEETSCNLCLKLKYDAELNGWFLMPYRLVWTAEDENGMVVGHLFAKLEHDQTGSNTVTNAHITSLNVIKSHRKQGIATRLMRKSHDELAKHFSTQYVSLNVRKSNDRAFRLYNEVMKYEIQSIKKGYYADGEDAYCMRYIF